MKKIIQHKKPYLLLGAAVLLLIGSGVFYAFRSSREVVRLDGFALRINPWMNDVKATEQYVSKIRLNEEFNCARVSGIEGIWSHSVIESGASKEAKGWNMNALDYEDREAKQLFLERVEQWKNLVRNGIDTDAGLQEYFQSSEYPRQFPPMIVDDFVTCGGYFHLPVYYQMLDNTGFDSALLAVALESQEKALGNVARFLLINKGESWLLFKEHKQLLGYYEATERCVGEDKDLFDTPIGEVQECSYNYWKNNFFSEKELNEWAQERLEMVSYSE